MFNNTKPQPEEEEEKELPLRKAVVQSVKGMRDILPADQAVWEKIRRAVHDVAEFYNFLRIETPVVERAEVFELSMGATSEVVEKQMFFVKSAKDRLVLRPEFTAGIVRAYIQNGLSHLGSPLKLYAFGSLFRHENPQAGRLREFHQADFEIISAENDPVYDAQVILAFYRVLESLKVKNVTVQVNTIGCRLCRPLYIRKLKAYYRDKQKNLCFDCKQRYLTNPLRILDCKQAGCVEERKDSPSILDTLCSYCKKHFREVLELIEKLSIPYSLNHYLVRGLDYYSKTVFEFFTEGFDFALVGGGRYDYLVSLLGGRETPAVGGAMGVERLIEVIRGRNINVANRARPRVFLIHIGGTAKHKSLALIEDFRKADIDIIESLGKESLKAQLKAADKAQSPLALILGQKEAYEGSIIIRDMKTGAQETVPLEKAIAAIKRKLKIS